VELLGNTMTIHQLFIERASIVSYLQTIPLDKQEIALVHALESRRDGSDRPPSAA